MKGELEMSAHGFYTMYIIGSAILIGAIILIYWFVKGRLNVFTHPLFEEPKEYDNYTIEAKKNYKNAILFMKYFWYFVYFMVAFGVMFGLYKITIPAIRDLPYVIRKEYHTTEGEIIYNDGTAITIIETGSNIEKKFRISTETTVGSHIKL